MPQALAALAPTLPKRTALSHADRSGRRAINQMDHMQSTHNGWATTLDSLVRGAMTEIGGDEIFVQTPRGAEVSPSTAAELPDRLRMLLLLVNGRRRMSDYRDLLPRYRNMDDTFDMLARKGYIERLGKHARR